MTCAKTSPASESEATHTASTVLRTLITASVALPLMATASAAGSGEEVPVVIHAVVCTADALDCTDVDTQGREFATMDACEGARQDLLANSSFFSTASRPILFARCRYAPWMVRRSIGSGPFPHNTGRIF